MPSFVCDICQETLKKQRLDLHKRRCRNAIFSCIDCNTSFQGLNYQKHTQCISEAEKYQKGLYKQKKQKNGKKEEADQSHQIKMERKRKTEKEIHFINSPLDQDIRNNIEFVMKDLLREIKENSQVSLKALEKLVCKKYQTHPDNKLSKSEVNKLFRENVFVTKKIEGHLVINV